MEVLNYFSHLPKRMMTIAIAAISVFAVSAAVMAGYGPDRVVKDYNLDPTGFDHVVFDSFINSPTIGDERDFLRDYDDNDPIDANVGDTVRVYMYVHNNADPQYNTTGEGVAENLKVRVVLPAANAANSQDVTGYISASNAVPQEIYDTFTINSSDQFTLEYVPGSARIKTNFMDNVALSDDIVAGGVLIGDDGLDGQMKGCFQYGAWVSFEVKLDKGHEPQTDYNLKKEVRIKGSDNWSDNVTADPGDELEYRIVINNTGETDIYGVDVTDNIPKGISFVPGSTRIYGNVAYPDTWFTQGLTVTKISAGESYTITYEAVVDQAKFECDVHSLTNVASATPDDLDKLQDDATVTGDWGECEQPETPVYECSAVDILKTGERKIKVTVDASGSPADRVSITGYSYNFGDSSTFEGIENVVEHTYNKDGKYNIDVTVSFDVDGHVKSVDCGGSVNFESLPPELPNTGPASYIAVLFGTSTLGIALKGWIKSRRGLRDTLITG